MENINLHFALIFPSQNLKNNAPKIIKIMKPTFSYYIVLAMYALISLQTSAGLVLYKVH